MHKNKPNRKIFVKQLVKYYYLKQSSWKLRRKTSKAKGKVSSNMNLENLHKSITGLVWGSLKA